MVPTLVVALALTACSGSDDDSGSKKQKPPLDDSGTTETTDTDTTYTPPPPWTPESGPYSVTSETETTNTCGDLSGGGTGGSSALQIQVAGDTSSFTIVGDDPVDTGSLTTTTTCPLTQVLEPDISYPFDCDALEAQLNLSEYSLQGVITFSVDVVGTWSTSTHFTATNTATVTCNGPDCDLVSDYLEVPFPCSVVSDSVVDKTP